MRNIHALAALAVGGLVVGGLAPAWAAKPTVPEMLAYQPRQKGVAITLPTEAEAKACSVENVDIKGKVRGYMLVDTSKVPLRKFFDSKGANRIDVWSYYKDGIEVYREIDSNGDNIPDQFRWLNSGGMKWGVDLDQDKKSTIDRWLMISSEEVAEEVFLAVVERNPARLQALFVNEAELRAMKLPAETVDNIRKSLQAAPAKFERTIKDIAGLDQAAFVRVESAIAGCVPAEDLGSDQDLIHYTSRAVLYEIPEGAGKKKHEWLHAGEMVQIGMAWRLLTAPSGQHDPTNPILAKGGTGTTTPSPVQPSGQLQKLLEILSGVDKEAEKYPAVPPGTKNPDVERYNLRRVQIIQQILQVPDLPADGRENWIKQLCDNLCNAHLASGSSASSIALNHLTQYKDQIVKAQSGSNLAGYATYRHLWAIYAPQIQKNDVKDPQKIQEKWHEELVRFVQTYPRAEDTPDALLQLGMGCEFAGKDEEAKRWFKTLADTFPDHFLAAKARGAHDRIGLVGAELKLAGPLLSNNDNSVNNFDIARQRGKVVVVYYWASYCSSCVGDMARLKQIHGTHAAKGLELVLVNLDDRKEDALRFLQANAVPATHLYQAPPKDATGMQSPYALQYGIMGLPTMFLVGRDGKVVNRSLQVNDLENELRKAL